MKSLIPGLFLCLLIGAAASLLSTFIPLGAITLAIILGVVAGNLFKPGAGFHGGIRFSEKKILSLAIALMGIKLDFSILSDLGVQSLAVVITTMALVITFSLTAAPFFRIDKKLSILLGIGNGVCGSSAIAATEHIIGAKREEAGLAIAIVNFLGTLGIFLLPFIASLLPENNDLSSGFLIGNTLQAVGQVVAAGFSISDKAGQTATIIKMSRVLMLFPLLIILLTAYKENRRDEGSRRWRRPPIPLFIIGFVLFSLIPTFDLLSAPVISYINELSKYCLITAMSAIGLGITFGNIVKQGKAALIAGSVIFMIQILLSSAAVLLIRF